MSNNSGSYNTSLIEITISLNSNLSNITVGSYNWFHLNSLGLVKSQDCHKSRYSKMVDLTNCKIVDVTWTQTII